MRLLSPSQVMCLLLLLICMVSCEETADSGSDPDRVARFFGKHKCGASPDYAIEIQSTLEPTRWDHVITVHGFVDDFDACKKIVDHLNRSTNDNYRAVPLNR